MPGRQPVIRFIFDFAFNVIGWVSSAFLQEQLARPLVYQARQTDKGRSK
jgi:hypothetical protein